MTKLIDTHSHPQFLQYDSDRAEMLARMRARDVSTIAVGTEYKTSADGVVLAEKEEGIWATIGVHPNDSEELFDAKKFEKLLSPKVVAIGECGLDYYRSDRAKDGSRQKENFEAQINFALAHNLPLMLHVRASQGTQNAHEDALDILESYQKENGEKVRGTAHFFTGSLDTAKRYWGLGFAVSFPGVITFAREYDEIVRAAPKGLMLSETDAPYAAPLPYRGKRNEPAYVEEVVRKIAELRGAGYEETAAQLCANAARIFRI